MFLLWLVIAAADRRKHDGLAQPLQLIDEQIASTERGNALKADAEIVNLTESCSEGFAAKEKGVPVARHT